MDKLYLTIFLVVGVFSSQAQASDKCKQFLDVIAVIDGSETIKEKDFGSIRRDMAAFVSDLGVQTNAVHFGAVTYSRTVSDIIGLSGNSASLKSALGKLNQQKEGTHTDLGIAQMTEMFKENGRDGVPKVGIVITDGDSYNAILTLQQATIAKNMGVNMFVIGIGDEITKPDELYSMASSRDQTYTIANFSQFTKLLTTQLIKVVCPTPAPPIQLGLCDGCKMRNGIGYNPHEDCNRFIQCAFQHNKLQTYSIHTCPIGTFWSQDKLTCDHVANVVCENDPCKSSVNSYKDGGDCAQFYGCTNKRSKLRKCPANYSYKYDRCSFDSTCQSDADGIPDTRVCIFNPRPNEICAYDWVLNGQSWRMLCPRGTIFSPSQCRCVNSDKDVVCESECKPIVDIDFSSDSSSEYDNYGAVIKNGVARFNGNANIKILSLANVEFKSKLTIKVSYKPDPRNDNAQAVVTNGDCGQEAPIVIADQGGNTIFRLQTNTQEMKKSIHTNSRHSWRTVNYVFDSGTFTGTLNGNTTTANVPGEIPRSQCALQLGHGTGLLDFVGYIDYIYVYTC